MPAMAGLSSERGVHTRRLRQTALHMHSPGQLVRVVISVVRHDFRCDGVRWWLLEPVERSSRMVLLDVSSWRLGVETVLQDQDQGLSKAAAGGR